MSDQGRQRPARDPQRRRCGALVLYYVLNKLAELLPEQVGGPGQAVRLHPARRSSRSALFLIYPAILTLIYSFANADLHGVGRAEELHRPAEHAATSRSRCSTRCCGSSSCRPSTVVLGLGVAVLADRLQPRRREARQDDHLPADGDQHGRRGHDLALRLRGRGRRAQPQIGLQNAILDGARDRPGRLAAAEPRSTSTASCSWSILIWAQVGFSMVLLSAAVKGVPDDTLEAGPHRRRQRAADLLPGRRPADLGHHHHGVHHRADRRDEDLRHRLRDDQRQLQHQRDRRRVLQPAVHQRQQRRRGRHRGHADDRGDPGHDLPGAPLPRPRRRTR